MKKIMVVAVLLLTITSLSSTAQKIVVRPGPCARMVLRTRPVIITPASRVVVRPRILRPAVIVVR